MRLAGKPFEQQTGIGTVRCLRLASGRAEARVILESAWQIMGVDFAAESARLRSQSDVWATIIDAKIVGPDGKEVEISIVDSPTFKT